MYFINAFISQYKSVHVWKLNPLDPDVKALSRVIVFIYVNYSKGIYVPFCFTSRTDEQYVSVFLFLCMGSILNPHVSQSLGPDI